MFMAINTFLQIIFTIIIPFKWKKEYRIYSSKFSSMREVFLLDKIFVHLGSMQINTKNDKKIYY